MELIIIIIGIGFVYGFITGWQNRKTFDKYTKAGNCLQKLNIK